MSSSMGQYKRCTKCFNQKQIFTLLLSCAHGILQNMPDRHVYKVFDDKQGLVHVQQV